MRSSVFALLIIVGIALGSPAPSKAMTPEEAQKACDDLNKAAQDSAKKMLQTGLPKQDPGKTFTNAVRSCLGNIAQFKDIYVFKQSATGAGIQEYIKKMATDMMNQYCQAATDEFNRRVQEALADVNDEAGDYGYQVGVGGGSGGAGGTSFGGTAPQPASVPGKSDDGFFGGLVNWFNGVKDGGNKP